MPRLRHQQAVLFAIPVLAVTSASVAALPAPGAMDQSCTPAWDAGLFTETQPGVVLDSIVWNDGVSDSLYVIGEGFERQEMIARWNGHAWVSLDDADNPSPDSDARAVAVHDDGQSSSLYIGGEFEEKSGLVVNNIARWDGDQWHGLVTADGIGVTGFVRSLESHDDGSGPALFVGGDFVLPGIPGRHLIAKWDGAAWTPIASREECCYLGTVSDFQAFDDGSGPGLFALGSFEQLNGEVYNGIAKWDGLTFQPLEHTYGVGLRTGGSSKMAVFDDGLGPELYLCGDFSVTGFSPSTVEFLAKWDGHGFIAIVLDFGPFLIPSEIQVMPGQSGQSDSLVVGVGGYPAGIFPDDLPMRFFRLRDGHWEIDAIQGDSQKFFGTPHAISAYPFDGEILEFVGGEIIINSSFDDSQAVTRVKGRWELMGNTLVEGRVLASGIYNDGTGPALIIGGDFTRASGRALRSLAKWNGFNWDAVDGHTSGLNGAIYAIETVDGVDGETLYVGGDFTSSVSGVELNHIAKFQDGVFQPVVDSFGIVGFDGPVHSLELFDDGAGARLYAGGAFTHAGFNRSENIARLENGSFVDLPGPHPSGPVYELKTLQIGTESSLFVGGDFRFVGNQRMNNVAAYDGAVWRSLDSDGIEGIDGEARALSAGEIDGKGVVYVGGDFSVAGGVPTGPIAAWDGTDWLSIGADAQLSSDATVQDLAVFDDGGGAALIVGGTSREAQGTRLTTYRDGVWERLEPAHWRQSASSNAWGVVSILVHEIASHPTLLAGLNIYSDTPEWHLSAYTGCPAAPCLADLDANGMLDLSDLVAFATGFIAQDPIADLAEPSGLFDLADIVAFVSSFSAGCP